MQNIRSCSFTGHRPKSFSFGYNEKSKDFQLLYSKIRNNIIQLINIGCTDFYTGMAEGVDLWCAEIVLDLKEKYYPQIKLYAVIPYLLQYSGMHPAFLERYKRVMQSAEERYLVGKAYAKGCYFKRNKFLVDKCDVLFAVYKESEEMSGTKQTINYAKKIGKKILILDMKKE